MADEIVLSFGGSGSALCDWGMNSNNNVLLWTNKGPFVIDCGSTFPFELRELGVPCASLLGILITHIHGDHINGIYAVAYSRWNNKKSPKLKTSIYAVDDVFQRLRIFLKAIFIDLDYNKVIDEHIIPMDGEFEIGLHKLKPFRVIHGKGEKVDKPAYGVEINLGKVCVTFSGDAEYRSNIHQRFPSSQVVFHDCMMNPFYEGTVHAHFEHLTQLSESEKKRTIIMGTNQKPDPAFVKSNGFHGIALRRMTYKITDQQISESDTMKSYDSLPRLQTTKPGMIDFPSQETNISILSNYEQQLLCKIDFGFLLYTEVGPVLIGCGTTVPQALKEISVSPHDLYGVVIPTISSLDFLGLEQLIWTRHYTPPFFTQSQTRSEKAPTYCLTNIYGLSHNMDSALQVLEPIFEGYTNSAGKLVPVDIAKTILSVNRGDSFIIGEYKIKLNTSVENNLESITIHNILSDHMLTIYYSGPIPSCSHTLLLPSQDFIVDQLMHQSIILPNDTVLLGHPLKHSFWENVCSKYSLKKIIKPGESYNHCQ